MPFGTDGFWTVVLLGVSPGQRHASNGKSEYIQTLYINSVTPDGPPKVVVTLFAFGEC